MTTLIGLSGSLRKASYNGWLLRAAGAVVPDGVALTIATIDGIPLYDGDAEEAGGIPGAVARLKDAIAAADGLLLATPEYNGGIPGVFKNAIDWLSRPPADQPRVFGGKPVALLGATPGPFGTVLAQDAWLPVLRVLGAAPWFGGRMVIPRATSVFDGEGALTDDATRERLRKFMQGFAGFAASVRAR